MVSAYSDQPASLAAGESDSSPTSVPNPHQNANVHHQTQLDQNHDVVVSTLANLQQQMQLLLKQHESLSAKNSAALSVARKSNHEQKIKRDELLNQMNNLAKQLTDIEHKRQQYNDAKSKTNKAFSRSTTFMILQLEKLTAENRQVVMDEANKNRDLKMMNEKLFTELDQLTAENAQLALEASRSNEQLLAENELLLHQSDQLARQIADANEELKRKNKQISEQLNKLAALVSTADKQAVDLNEMNSIQSRQSRKRVAHEMEDDNHDDICDDVMDQYTKCCVCLEPYEVEPGASCENRLPIKSATCSHTLCESCVDNCFASLLASGKSNVRYVTCPQCRTKRAFDVQNKVVDCFLREYIMRCKAVSKRRVKSKDMRETTTEDSDEVISISSSVDSTLNSPTMTPSRTETTMWDAGF